MTKKKKIIIILGAIIAIVGIAMMMGSNYTISNKTKSVNNNKAIYRNKNINSNTNQQVSKTETDTKTETKTENDKIAEPVDNNSELDTNPKTSEEINYAELSDDEKLLYDFGFYGRIGCGNIFTTKYSEEYKMVMALRKVDKSKYIKKKCSELYSESQLKGDYYSTDYGICKKDSTTSLIPYEEANKIYKEMYGTDMNKKGFTTTNMNGTFYNFFDYNESQNSYVYLDCGGCGGSCGNMMSILKIKSSNEINNKKYIEVYGYFGELKQSKKMYNNSESKILILESGDNSRIELKAKDYESAKQEILTEKLDSLDVYEIVFNKIDGKYVFESFAKKLS